jgi:hypothetical protein
MKNKRGRKPLCDWDAQPLGQIPDWELAEKLGCSRAIVGFYRNKRGIPIKRKKREADNVNPRIWRVAWNEVCFWSKKDIEIARELGVSKERVRQMRCIYHVPPRPPHHHSWTQEQHDARRKFSPKVWDQQPLGKVSDGKIAQELGCCTSTVAQERRRRGILPWQPIPEDELHMLGTLPDARLAERWGCALQTVLLRRYKLGIPSWRSQQRRKSEK